MQDQGHGAAPVSGEHSPHTLRPGHPYVCSSFMGNICSRCTFRNQENHPRVGLWAQSSHCEPDVVGSITTSSQGAPMICCVWMSVLMEAFIPLHVRMLLPAARLPQQWLCTHLERSGEKKAVSAGFYEGGSYLLQSHRGLEFITASCLLAVNTTR